MPRLSVSCRQACFGHGPMWNPPLFASGLDQTNEAEFPMLNFFTGLHAPSFFIAGNSCEAWPLAHSKDSFPKPTLMKYSGKWNWAPRPEPNNFPFPNCKPSANCFAKRSQNRTSGANCNLGAMRASFLPNFSPSIGRVTTKRGDFPFHGTVIGVCGPRGAFLTSDFGVRYSTFDIPGSSF